MFHCSELWAAPGCSSGMPAADSPAKPSGATPDLERLPFAFEPGSSRERWRVELGRRLLVNAVLRGGQRLSGGVTDGIGRSLARGWARSVARALDLSIDVSGLERIDPTRQYLVGPLHESFVDVPVLLHLPLALRFTVREELMHHPHIGSLLERTGQISVPERPTVETLHRLLDSISLTAESGQSVVVFPQGSVLGVEAAFSKGLVVLSRRLGLPILPVVLTGTHGVWGHPFDNTVHLHQTAAMHILEPVPSEAVNASSFRSLEREMKARALRQTAAPVRHFNPTNDGWWDGYAYDIDPDFEELAAAVAEHRVWMSQAGSNGTSVG